MKHLAEWTLLLVVSLIGLTLTEIGYRWYLFAELQRAATPFPTPESVRRFGFYKYPSPWRFDNAMGFAYTEGPWLAGRITSGQFDHCGSVQGGNRFGNYGAAIGDYESAELKIMLIGSSFTLFALDGPESSTSNQLQARLGVRLGKSVHVLNYSRDATGILASFDIAAARVDDMRPDLILFAFNSTAFGYQRNWRVVVPAAHGFWRMYFTIDPDETPRPGRSRVHPNVISEGVSEGWCRRLTALRRRERGDPVLAADPLVKSMVEEYGRLLTELGTKQIGVDFMSVSRSFIWNALWHGDPFHRTPTFVEDKMALPQHLDSFADDTDYMAAVAKLRVSGVPFLLVHLPSLADLRQGQGMVFGISGTPEARERALARSLEETTGQKIIHLIDYYSPEALARPLRLVAGEHDSHPGALGNAEMAAALEHLLLSHPELLESGR